MKFCEIMAVFSNTCLLNGMRISCYFKERYYSTNAQYLRSISGCTFHVIRKLLSPAFHFQLAGTTPYCALEK